MKESSEVRNGLRIDWNVPIAVRDGTILRGDVFRPIEEGRYPTLANYGPYGKGLAFADGFPNQWRNLLRDHPEVAEGTTSDFANWESVDPEKWVPHGYVVLRVDSRGAGQSPGIVDPWSEDEVNDFYDCIEWAAAQSWSNGSVGLAGVSYYATTQWTVAARKPPHLKAICPFEGYTDFYRDAIRHGGILSTFLQRWYPLQVVNVQHGLGSRARISRMTGAGIAGDVDMQDDELERNRVDMYANISAARFDDGYAKARSAVLADIEVPLLSCGNWGGQGMHLRGNIEGFVGAASPHKWLELHGYEHWTEFYTDYGVSLQRQFFDRYLKGERNGWDDRPPVLLQVRHVDGFVERTENEWPIARTAWTRWYLDAETHSLTPDVPADAGGARFAALTEKATFWSEPFGSETEMTGPMAAKLFASSSTTDADVFIAVRLYDPSGAEVLFNGASDPNAPLTLGWLRASHRRLDPDKTLPYRPYHVHDQAEPLQPGVEYELDVEIWPTSIVIPAGYRIALTISGADYQHDLPEPWPEVYGIPLRGASVMLHDDPSDRPADIYGGETTIMTGAGSASYIMLPFVPAREAPGV